MAKAKWLFVDDKKEEAAAHAAELNRACQDIEVECSLPGEFRARVLTGEYHPSGVLLDIDFSSLEPGTGAGIAQDIRLKQRARKVKEFPVIRFAGREPVQTAIAGDPGSDDLFDVKISKESAREDRRQVISHMRGVREIYTELQAHADIEQKSFLRLVGLDEDTGELWSDWAFHSAVAAARDVAVHVAAGIFLRDFILSPGLLVNEQILSFRLGIDPAQSGQAWPALLEKFSSVRYQGSAKEFFPRWWAKGLEFLWLSLTKKQRSLALSSAVERVECLTLATGIKGLIPLKMPDGSAGDRPWGPCALSYEKHPSEWVPVDPKFSVRVAPRQARPTWIDPLYASIGQANQNKRDKRLYQDDLERLNSLLKARK